MECKIILTGIIRYHDEFLIVKRSNNDSFMPNAWEFPGGNLELGEIIDVGLTRELNEEIGYYLKPGKNKLINYSDEIKIKNSTTIHVIELDFLIDETTNQFIVQLSDEHSEYKWVKKDSNLMDDFIKSKLNNI